MSLFFRRYGKLVLGLLCCVLVAVLFVPVSPLPVSDVSLRDQLIAFYGVSSPSSFVDSGSAEVSVERASLEFLDLDEPIAVHIHPVLLIFVDGELVGVPDGVGIDEDAYLFSQIHTHDSSATLHVESNESSDVFLLSDALLAVGFSCDCDVSFFVGDFLPADFASRVKSGGLDGFSSVSVSDRLVDQRIFVVVAESFSSNVFEPFEGFSL